MVNTLFLPELREMLADDNRQELREFCCAIHPAGTAEFMEGLSSDEVWQVLRHADLASRSEIFHYFDRDRQLELIRTQPREEIAQLIASMAPDDRVDILNDLEPEVVQQLLEMVPSEHRRDILRLSAYPEGTAGAVMTTEVANLNESVTVSPALMSLP
jgi:magnesium transporter